MGVSAGFEPQRAILGQCPVGMRGAGRGGGGWPVGIMIVATFVAIETSDYESYARAVPSTYPTFQPRRRINRPADGRAVFSFRTQVKRHTHARSQVVGRPMNDAWQQQQAVTRLQIQIAARVVLKAASATLRGTGLAEVFMLSSVLSRAASAEEAAKWRRNAFVDFAFERRLRSVAASAHIRATASRGATSRPLWLEFEGVRSSMIQSMYSVSWCQSRGRD